MAKDAGGHGSEKRGAAGLAAARERGGHVTFSPLQPRPVVVRINASEHADKQAAGALAQGHPKSAAVDTHPSMHDAHDVAGAVAKAFVKPGQTAIHPEFGKVTIVKVKKDGSAVVRDSTGAQGTTMIRGLLRDPGASSWR